jgi:cytochrome c1
MKKMTLISLTLLAWVGAIIIFNNGCAVSQKVTAKSGSQLWGENCIRCHNAPASDEYSGAEWEVIGMHMKQRANLTDDEMNKIVTFLKQEN